jgi:CDP-diglyceride synthetase
MTTTSVVINIVLVVVALTLWIWEPKAWAFSVWIGVCVVWGLWDYRKKNKQDT